MLHKINAALGLVCCLLALSFAPMPGVFAEEAANPHSAGPITAKEAAKHVAKVGTKDYTEAGFLAAAYDFCSTVQNRSAKSCECEQKLLKDKDRFGAEEREMAFYYFTDKDRYLKEFTSRIAADPKWQKGFATRMSNMQALIIAACGP